jgi:hypothetical protein
MWSFYEWCDNGKNKGEKPNYVDRNEQKSRKWKQIINAKKH